MGIVYSVLIVYTVGLLWQKDLQWEERERERGCFFDSLALWEAVAACIHTEVSLPIFHTGDLQAIGTFFLKKKPDYSSIKLEGFLSVQSEKGC